jgi:hypothetical protein
MEKKALALAVLLMVGLQAYVRAHDVPDEILFQSYLKPAGTQLQVLLRIPLLAVTDTNLPKNGTGYLAMEYLDPALRDAANQIAAGIVFLENDDACRNSTWRPRDLTAFGQIFRGLRRRSGSRARSEAADSTSSITTRVPGSGAALSHPVARIELRIQVLFGKGLANRTHTFVTFIRPDGAIRAFQLVDQTGVVRLDPSRLQASWVFLTAGLFRFLDGIDHCSSSWSWRCHTGASAISWALSPPSRWRTH